MIAFAKSNPACSMMLSIPGVGVIVATVLFSAVANISDFRSGRDLAAFLGLVPRQRQRVARLRFSAYRSEGTPMSEY
jgi:transposase